MNTKDYCSNIKDVKKIACVRESGLETDCVSGVVSVIMCFIQVLLHRKAVVQHLQKTALIGWHKINILSHEKVC